MKNLSKVEAKVLYFSFNNTFYKHLSISHLLCYCFYRGNTLIFLNIKLLVNIQPLRGCRVRTCFFYPELRLLPGTGLLALHPFGVRNKNAIYQHLSITVYTFFRTGQILIITFRTFLRQISDFEHF